jgi:hypothetical protein
MKRSMEQVEKAALENAPVLLLAKTTGFFDNMCCATYLREQVAAEPIELDYEGDDNSIMVPAFMWMDIDESGAEEYKSEGEWTDDEADNCGSDCEVFSRSPGRKIEIIESDRTPATPPPPYYLTKSPSRSHSTATTVTENSCITSHSWETECSLWLPDPASDEIAFPKIKSISISNSSAPRKISVPSFKLKKRQSSIDFPYLLRSSMSMPDM